MEAINGFMSAGVLISAATGPKLALVAWAGPAYSETLWAFPTHHPAEAPALRPMTVRSWPSSGSPGTLGYPTFKLLARPPRKTINPKLAKLPTLRVGSSPVPGALKVPTPAEAWKPIAMTPSPASAEQLTFGPVAKPQSFMRMNLGDA